MPKVSVIVPNYNHARFLRQRVDTILAQTFQDFELILLDDCSTDDSRSILSSYSGNPHVSSIEFNEKNSGSTFKQWNKGVRLARGEYVWLAESDDYSDPHFLERLVAVLDSKPEVVFVSCRSWRVDADGNAAGYADATVPDWARYECGAEIDGREECENYFAYTTAVCNASSVLFRKSAYESAGGADETFRFCGDRKTWAAMALTGRVAYLSEPLNYYRVHANTVSARSEQDALWNVEYLRLARWMLSKVTPTATAREKLHQNLQRAWAPAVAAWRLPPGRRWSLLRDAIAIDPAGTLRRLIPAGLAALRRKFLKHWRSLRPGAQTT
jgi:glycosyltransferase involved in cell wall biosynthesis